MHEGGWITFGLGHWLYGVLFWGIIIYAIVTLLKNINSSDD